MRLSAVALAQATVTSFHHFHSNAFTPLLPIRHHHPRSQRVLEAKKKRSSQKIRNASPSSPKGFAGSLSTKHSPPPLKESQSKPSTDGTSEFHSDMVSWLSRHPLTYISPKFHISPSELGGYGGFCSTTDSMQQNELIFRIPRECCVTFDDALNDKWCGEAFRAIRQKRDPDWSLLLIAGWIAKEYIMADLYSNNPSRREEQSWNDTIASRIKHWPYLKTLPWKPGLLSQDHVLFWSEDEIETLLKGSLAYDDAILIKSRVQDAIRIMSDAAMGSWILEEMEEMAPGQSEGSNLIDGLERAVTGAYVIALSRSFAEEVECDKEDGTTSIEVEVLLVPLLDILQHSNNPNTMLESYDDYIIMRARRAIQPGEELFHQYREEDDAIIPPHKFFTRYGFVPGVREPVVDLLKKRSPLFFD
ncbi:hypothetical protein HJC23_006947 [Cyclotella cryptica]|uniref:SET domain-containing protein n=1 Tax=Cyclotella cryptica TaxID=29204 RepID=A0ABD3QMH8_9STRA